MGSPFDALRDQTFDQTTNVFGYDCIWNATDGGTSFSGKVHFKNPTSELRMVGVEYDEEDWTMEYKEGDFIGLYERVEARNDDPELVTIDGNLYYVKKIKKIHDGATYIAALKPSV